MKVIDLSLKRPVTITMFFTALLVFGFLSISKLPISLLPDISYPTLTIRTDYSGAAPAEVENLVSRPVEETVGAVTNLQRLSSVSRPEQSDVMLEFDWDTDMDIASLEVREKLDVLQLPDGASKPVILKFDPSLDPIMRIGVYGEQDLVKLRILAEDKLKRDMERLEGVAAVEVSGGLEEEIQIMLDTGRMSSFGISLQEVSSRLQTENIDLAGGKLEDGDTEYLVRTLSRFLTVQEIGNLVVTVRNNAPIFLKDIAKINKGHEERKRITRLQGIENVELAVYKEAQSNTVMLSREIKNLLKETESVLNKRTQNPIKLEVIEDQSRFINRSIEEVRNSAIFGGLLAIFILYLFLRSLKSTTIIGLSIPVSVLITFFFMYIFNISLNIMSLGGLTLGIGMLVDNSIVVLEAIDRHAKKKSSLDASRAGTKEVAMAIAASTLTTVFVFVPIVFVKGVAGQLFRDQALTVTFSLAASLLVALTLIPMLASLSKQRIAATLPPEEGKPFFMRIWSEWLMTRISSLFKMAFAQISRFFKFLMKPAFAAHDASLAWLMKNHPKVLDKALEKPWKLIGIVFVIFLISLALFTHLGGELIPEMFQGQFYSDLRFPAGTPIERVDSELSVILKDIRKLEPVEEIYTVSGTTSKTGGNRNEQRENLAQIFVFLKNGSSEDDEQYVIAKMRNKFRSNPGLEFEFGRPAFFSYKTPIEVYIQGRNLDILNDLASRLKKKMDMIPGLVDIRSSMEGGNPEAQIRFDRVKLAAIGTDLSSVASLIRTKVLGDVPSEFVRLDRKIGIRIRADEQYRKNLKNLEDLNIAPTGGKPIPLKSVAEIKIDRGPVEIRRVSQERTALITANLKDTDLASASEKINVAMNSIRMPEGYTVEIGGQRKEMSSSFRSLIFAISLAIFLVYLVMASSFESLLHPFVIMFTIPFALIGVVIILMIFGLTINVVVLIGIILLAGIVVNNAIVLIDYTNQLRANGMEKKAAMKKAAQVRMRPILMTTLTTVLGLLPMAISISEGSELRVPMALTVIGGLSFATLLTLIVIPSVYIVLDRKK